MKTNSNPVKLTEIFKALSDLNRLRIIRMLASNMVNTLTVSDLAEKLAISQPAASQHIKVLKHIGLLKPIRDGYRVYYHIDLDILNETKDTVDTMFELVFQKCSKFGQCQGHD